MTSREGHRMVRLERTSASLVAGVVVVVVVALGGCRKAAPAASVPASVIGSNGQITIPDGSPLRSALSFDTARTVTLSDIVTATAAVESDPARTVKLFPPMAGRVVALNVRLGRSRFQTGRRSGPRCRSTRRGR
jgi:cobalt-zinc-cadmium efflux system membrane fusion protein